MRGAVARGAIGAFCYFRHFILLAAASVVILGTREWRVLPTLSASFGMYGALHASTLVLSLRRRATWRRAVLFITVGASLSLVNVTLASLAGRHPMTRLGAAWPSVSLILASGAGAAAYGGMVRAFWIDDLTWRSIVCLAFSGAAVTFVVVLGRSALPMKSTSLLAVLWWYAFSCTLWYHDAWRRAMKVPHVRDP